MLNKIKDKIHKDCISSKKIIAFTDEITYLNQLLKAEKERNQPISWMVDPNYVFSIGKTGMILLNGDQITSQELKNLKSEVRALKEFEIYKILQATLRQKAIERAILTSTDLYSLKGNEQVLAGKMMVFSLDVIKTIINDIDAAKMK